MEKSTFELERQIETLTHRNAELEAALKRSKPAPAAPQAKPATYNGPNPWIRATWNFTKQTELKDSDPALAERLKAEAEKANQAASYGVRTGIPASRYRK